MSILSFVPTTKNLAARIQKNAEAAKAAEAAKTEKLVRTKKKATRPDNFIYRKFGHNTRGDRVAGLIRLALGIIAFIILVSFFDPPVGDNSIGLWQVVQAIIILLMMNILDKTMKRYI